MSGNDIRQEESLHCSVGAAYLHLRFLLICFYCICSVIRLAFFNVLETKRQQEEDGANKYYHGLPITSMAIVLPLVFMIQTFISDDLFKVVLHLTLLVVGLLFVWDFKLKKPNNTQLTILVIVVAIAIIIMVLFSRYKLPKWNFPNTGFFDWLRGIVRRK